MHGLKSSSWCLKCGGFSPPSVLQPDTASFSIHISVGVQCHSSQRLLTDHSLDIWMRLGVYFPSFQQAWGIFHIYMLHLYGHCCKFLFPSAMKFLNEILRLGLCGAIVWIPVPSLHLVISARPAHIWLLRFLKTRKITLAPCTSLSFAINSKGLYAM